jgi:hypothetical protein
MQGGKRLGAGRKPIENKKVQIYFSVTLKQKNDKSFKDFIKKQIENYGIR